MRYFLAILMAVVVMGPSVSSAAQQGVERKTIIKAPADPIEDLGLPGQES